jgi:hypothetical protein
LLNGVNRQLLELGPDIDAYNRLGKALAELGRHDEALATLLPGTPLLSVGNPDRLQLQMHVSAEAAAGVQLRDAKDGSVEVVVES